MKPRQTVAADVRRRTCAHAGSDRLFTLAATLAREHGKFNTLPS